MSITSNSTSVIGYAFHGTSSDCPMFKPNNKDLPRCPACGFSNDLEMTNPKYVMKSRYVEPDDSLCETGDGRYIASLKLKEFCESEGYPGLRFLPLVKDPLHFHLIVDRVINRDEGRSPPVRDWYCKVCQRHRQVYGIEKSWLETEPLEDGLYRSNIITGTYDDQSYNIYVGLNTPAKLIAAGVTKDFRLHPILGVKNSTIASAGTAPRRPAPAPGIPSRSKNEAVDVSTVLGPRIGYGFGMPTSGSRMFKLKYKNAPRCPACGYLTDLEMTNPNYVFRPNFVKHIPSENATKTAALTSTPDGKWIASVKLKEFCESEGYPGLRFLPFVNDPYHFHLFIDRIIHLDERRNPITRGKYCAVCNRHREMYGPNDHYLETEPLEDGLYRDNVMRGYDDWQHYSIYVGLNTPAKLMAARVVKADYFTPIFGCDPEWKPASKPNKT